MVGKKVIISLNIGYAIESGKLKTTISYPIEFLELDDVDQVQLIGSLIDLLNKTEIPTLSDGTDFNLESAHDSLVTEGGQLFPFGSTIKLDLTRKEKSVGVEFMHDKSIGTLHSMHTAVLIDSIIKVLTAMAIMVVRRVEVRSAQ